MDKKVLLSPILGLLFALIGIFIVEGSSPCLSSPSAFYNCAGDTRIVDVEFYGSNNAFMYQEDKDFIKQYFIDQVQGPHNRLYTRMEMYCKGLSSTKEDRCIDRFEDNVDYLVNLYNNKGVPNDDGMNREDWVEMAMGDERNAQSFAEGFWDSLTSQEKIDFTTGHALPLFVIPGEMPDDDCVSWKLAFAIYMVQLMNHDPETSSLSNSREIFDEWAEEMNICGSSEAMFRFTRGWLDNRSFSGVIKEFYWEIFGGERMIVQKRWFYN